MSETRWTPISGAVLPRYAGVPSFMRLPQIAPDDPRADEVEIGLIGMPWDGATSNRPGARHGPRGLRDASTMIREMNRATGQVPFSAARCADMGDVAMSPVNQDEALSAAEATIAAMLSRQIRPVMVGGDHLCTLTVLRALRRARGAAFGLILLDSHTDLYPPYFGGKTLTHGNPFRQAIEEGCIDPHRTFMAGMRGTAYNTSDFDYGRDKGVHILPIETCMARGWSSVMEEARAVVGSDPVYVSFDIDFVDPAYAPGTGTPEVGGPTSFEALQCVRALRGLDIIGSDLVEVSPPFDPSGTTSWLGASILFELICAMQS
ncbi:Agmatinase [Roseibacterium elongatum DSM 19469]|uniref:Agmatinase n=1 Tax=Roseicyclus elongatus DSM 19469 TaxID=1294273 RepID=W8S526_9RHOB|nr:agmatinase [Roseibacterium elongatum]AHM05332.1 Agmatinase [Roseibacterium elongatum DSM 19469]